MHMENMVMGIAFGTAVSIFKNYTIKGFKGTYNQIKLQDIEDETPKVFPVKGNRFANVSAENFSKIPGSPVAYWVSDAIAEIFVNGTALEQICAPKRGLCTCANDKFYKNWHEINCIEMIIGGTPLHSDGWIPLNKGGEFRKWYGNL